MDIHGVPVRPGEMVVTLLGRANRPRTFPDPDRFDVGREGAAPLSFASGVHYCLGRHWRGPRARSCSTACSAASRVIEPAWPDGTRPTVRPLLSCAAGCPFLSAVPRTPAIQCRGRLWVLDKGRIAQRDLVLPDAKRVPISVV